MALSAAPKIVPLDRTHDRMGFTCGDAILDGYLRTQASQDASRNIAQVWVAIDSSAPVVDPNSTSTQKTPIIGYYTLSATSFVKADLPENLAKRLPHYPVPAAILGRLAVSKAHQGQSIGKFLVFDAFNRVVAMSEQIAIYALIVDAKYPNVVPFYQGYGFRVFPSHAQRLFILVDTLTKSAK